MSEYYIGLDVGTNSVGWAATDTAYSLLKYRGNAMWGVRLFDDANDASERRSSRTARRLHARSKQRLALLELLFSEALAEKDPLFLTRLAESALQEQDRSSASCRYALFNDPDFTDREYFKRYPTAYHLRSELIHSTVPHDIRLDFTGTPDCISQRLIVTGEQFFHILFQPLKKSGIDNGAILDHLGKTGNQLPVVQGI